MAPAAPAVKGEATNRPRVPEIPPRAPPHRPAPRQMHGQNPAWGSCPNRTPYAAQLPVWA